MLGACIGEAINGKKLGKAALLWGAAAQSIPDIDFVASFWMNTADNLMAHRGFTHSVLFGLLVTPFCALLAERIHRPHNISLKRWILFFAAEIFIHLLLDGFNAYGVGWFEPFSHRRFSFNALFVADPLFSVWAGIAFLMLLILKRNHQKRKLWWQFALVMTGAYTCYCLFCKWNIDREVRFALKTQRIPYTGYFSTPTALNSMLWYVVAENDSGAYVGYRSVYDTEREIDFHFFPRNEHLLSTVEDHESLQKLKRFSQGFYTVESWGDTLVFNDLRFGQIVGWINPEERFVFHYFIKEPDGNKLVVQRGRFAKWDKDAVFSLLRRIRSN